jgi:hypothetical protein
MRTLRKHWVLTIIAAIAIILALFQLQLWLAS